MLRATSGRSVATALSCAQLFTRYCIEILINIRYYIAFNLSRTSPKSQEEGRKCLHKSQEGVKMCGAQGTQGWPSAMTNFCTSVSTLYGACRGVLLQLLSPRSPIETAALGSQACSVRDLSRMSPFQGVWHKKDGRLLCGVIVSMLCYSVDTAIHTVRIRPRPAVSHAMGSISARSIVCALRSQ